MVDEKVFLCRNKSLYANEFWTGRAWTSEMMFARKYDFHDALPILRKRFANKYPQPLIVRHKYFVEKLVVIRKRAAAKRAREQAKKQAEKLAKKGNGESMTHPYRKIAAKLRAKGKLATRKEIKALNEFYRDVFSDVAEDEAIEKANREIVKRKFFHSNGHCKVHNNLLCIYCVGKLRG